MTDNRETIAMLKVLKEQALKSHNDTAVLKVTIDSFNFVIDKAIKALEQEPCEDWYDVPSDEMILEQARQAVKDLRKKLAERLEQEPCEDAISRQAVLDIIMPYCQDDDGSVENTGDLRNALDDIEALPPVTPKEKTGHWYIREIYSLECNSWECSECKEVIYEKTKYCPNCGARMVNE